MISGLLTLAALATTLIVCGRLTHVVLPPGVGPASPPNNGRSTLPIAPDGGPVESGAGDAGRTPLRSLDYLEAFDLEPADLEDGAT